MQIVSAVSRKSVVTVETPGGKSMHNAAFASGQFDNSVSSDSCNITQPAPSLQRYISANYTSSFSANIRMKPANKLPNQTKGLASSTNSWVSMNEPKKKKKRKNKTHTHTHTHTHTYIQKNSFAGSGLSHVVMKAKNRLRLGREREKEREREREREREGDQHRFLF